MAHAQGTSVRIQRLTSLIAICAVAISVGFSFGRILQGTGATYRMLAVALVSGVLAWATERRGMLVATLVSAAGLVLAVTWLVASSTAWLALPTTETVRTVGTLATQVGGQAREYVSPAPMTPALVLAGVVAVWAAMFSCYALAFRAQSPLLGLIPPLALIVFADSVLEEFIRPLYGVGFLVAALAVLFADSLRRLQGWGVVWNPTGNRDRLLPIASRNARRLGLAALGLAIIAPALMPGFGTKSVFSLSSINSDGKIRLSPLVSMGAQLRAAEDGENPELFRVATDEPSYWRMEVLDTYSGSTWEATPDDGVPVTSGVPIPGLVQGRTEVVQTVTILADGAYPWLPAAATPTLITTDKSVSWHPESLSLQTDDWPDAGQSYVVTSMRSDPTAGDLRAAGTDKTQTAMMALPDGIPSVVADTAHEWTDGLGTDFDKVMAIQSQLQTFSYDTDPGLSDDPESLADFLEVTKRGFCQQFASAMAVMLRELGIPARLALGFTPGTSSTTDGVTSFTARALQYHAWVEVPFKGSGWLPFDPTPKFNGDPSASYLPKSLANDPTCLVPSRGCTETGGHPDDHIRRPTKDPELDVLNNGIGGDLGSDAAAPTQRRPIGALLAVALALLALIAIGVPVRRSYARRRRLRAAKEPRELIVATYDVFADRAADLGWPKGQGETPREFGDRLRELDVLDDAHRDRVVSLTSTVVRAAYSRAEPGDEAPGSAQSDADAILDALRHSTPWRQRLRGIYARD